MQTVLVVAVAFIAGLFIGITVGTLVGESRMLDLCQKREAVCAPKQS